MYLFIQWFEVITLNVKVKLGKVTVKFFERRCNDWKYLIVKKLSKYILINSSRAGIYLLKLNTVNTAKSAQM